MGCAWCDAGFLGRRGLISGAAALSLTAPLASARGQGNPSRIDVHHHIVPPAWLDALKTAKLDTPPMVKWSPEQSLEDMEKGGVAIAMVSPTTPQVGFPASNRCGADCARVKRICAQDGRCSSRAVRCFRDAADALCR
jgi:6-methylsalicylate decarboxylase